MRRTLRAVALAAAAITISTGGAFAGPSLATGAEVAPATHYADHGAPAPFVAELGLDTPEASARLAHDVDFTTPVATHAVAELDTSPTPSPRTPTDEPAQRNGRSLSELVRDLAGSTTPDAESECLARAVYFESKGEPLAGQLSVAEVIINRSRSGRFASTICGVVRQPSQFSFVRRGHIPAAPNNAQWRTAVAIAQIALRDLADGGAPRALFFHARRVSPGWRNLTRVATVGNHIFYR